MIKLNKRYRLKIIHVYTKTASYEDEAVVNFYEDIESAMNKRTSQFEIAMGDFNRKVGAKKVGEKSVGNLELALATVDAIHRLNSRREIHTNYCTHSSRNAKVKNGLGKVLKGLQKQEINFILSDNPGIAQHVEIRSMIRFRDVRVVRCKVKLNVKKERRKLVKGKKLNVRSVTDRKHDCKITF